MEYILLGETDDSEVAKLLETYRENKYHARVIFMNNGSNKIERDRVCVFLKETGDFEIAWFRKSWGMSKTSRVYSREKKIQSIFKSKNGFFFVKGKIIKPLTLGTIRCSTFSRTVLKFLCKYIPSLEIQDKNNLLLTKSLNYLIEHKITSLRKMLNFKYNLPYPTIKKLLGNRIVQQHQGSGDNRFDFLITKNRDYITNLENLNMEFLSDYKIYNMFVDAVNMARILDKKVNATWSIKRLKQEHDAFASEITDITYTFDNRKLNIAEIFIKFAEFSKYHMLTTTKEMSLESKKQKHCVASYVGKVDKHECAIYHIEEHTLEVGFKNGLLANIQFRGYDNQDPPEKLLLAVNDKIAEYNAIHGTFSKDYKGFVFDLVEKKVALKPKKQYRKDEDVELTDLEDFFNENKF